MRLDKYLVEAGFVSSRTLAAKLIAAGDVQVNGKVARKASMLVGPEDTLYVRQSELTEYVSRAGHKLAGALDAFPDIEVEGKRCLDAGASTGGFTDVLLRRGARHVAAVDVGHGQLVDALREEPRVGVYEGLNVRYLKPEDIGGQVELTVSDLSFISLTLVMEALANATETGGDLVLMVKPQFEVGKERLAHGGVVRDPGMHIESVLTVAARAHELGVGIDAVTASPLPGPAGNVEYFINLHAGRAGTAADLVGDALLAETDRAVAEGPAGRRTEGRQP